MTGSHGSGLRLAVLVVLLVVVAGAGFVIRPPYLIFHPGPTANASEDIAVEGTWSEPNAGTYLVTTVSTRRPNAYGFLWANLSGADMTALHDYIPRGSTSEEFFARQRDVFRQSRVIAAAAAADASGFEIRLSGTGAVVVAVVPKSPAARASLKPGDVIVAVDGQEVSVATDAQSALASRPVGTAVTLTIARDGDRRTIDVTTARLRALEDVRSGIGVALATRDFQVDVPFDVNFTSRQIGGPSAGLAYALAIADMVQQRDFTHGVVAASGTITPTGEVGPVGGLRHKAVAAADAGADLFLVPEAQLHEVGNAPDGLKVRGVDDLSSALGLLYATVAGA